MKQFVEAAMNGHALVAVYSSAYRGELYTKVPSPCVHSGEAPFRQRRAKMRFNHLSQLTQSPLSLTAVVLQRRISADMMREG